MVIERFERFASRGLEPLQEIGLHDHLHSLTTATSHRLDKNRAANLAGLFEQQLVVLGLSMVAGQHWDTGGDHDPLGLVLDAHDIEMLSMDEGFGPTKMWR